MARTVKIPDCSSTFDVFLNGAKYSFIGGTEVEVEDEIANLIEQHNKEHTPKEAPKTVAPFGAGGGPVEIKAEWDNDKNKYTCALSFEEVYDIVAHNPLVYVRLYKDGEYAIDIGALWFVGYSSADDDRLTFLAAGGGFYGTFSSYTGFDSGFTS